MDAQLLLACWGMMTFMVLVPGPDWAYVIAAGTRDRTIVPALGGILIGYLLAVIAVAVGVGAALAALPWALVVLTLAAAGYLSYLGIRILLHPPAVAAAGATSGADAPAAWLRLAQGVGVSGLNPKGLLVLVVLLPQFTDAAGDWPIPVQLAVLGLIFVGSCALVYSVVGVGAKAVIRARPSAMRIVSRVSGAAMVLLAIVLVAEQLAHLSR
jgi:threonine/homoserine/homoserine lactone efflux protein